MSVSPTAGKRPVVVIACQVLQDLLEKLLPENLADRVTFMDYDNKLEMALAIEDKNDTIGIAWVKKVQSWRRAADKEKIRHIISPRASIKGAAKLRAGRNEDKIADKVVWKGLDKARWATTHSFAQITTSPSQPCWMLFNPEMILILIELELLV